jgi:predicted XRE-type DNA-binding protein
MVKSKKPFLFKGKDKHIALTLSGDRIELVGESKAEIDELLKERKKVGIQIAKKLKSHGLMSAEDAEEVGVDDGGDDEEDDF